MSLMEKRPGLLARPVFAYQGTRPGELRRKLSRWLIVLAVLGVSASVGLIAASEYWIAGAAALAAVVVLFGALFYAEHLDWSLLILLITAAYTPFYLPTGTSSIIVDSLLVTVGSCALWFLRMLVVEKRFHLEKSAANVPALGFMLVSVLSLAWSTVFRDPLVYTWDTFPLVQVASTLVMVMLPGAFLLVANHTNSERLLKWGVYLMVVTGVVGLIQQILQMRLVNNNGLFDMWIIAFSLGLAYFNRRMSSWMRFALLGVVAVYVYFSFVVRITWVSGWLPGFVAMGILTLNRSKKLLAVMIIAGLAVVATQTTFFQEQFNAEKEESGYTRIAAWKLNWQVTGEHVLFGTGPGGYAAYYMTYYPNQGMATHNNYIDVVAQTGVMGLGLWLWFFGAVLWSGFRLIRRVKGRGDFMESLANVLFAGTSGCIVIMMFGDWLLPFAYTQTIAGYDYAVYSWIFMGMIVAMHRILDKQAEEAAHA